MDLAIIMYELFFVHSAKDMPDSRAVVYIMSAAVNLAFFVYLLIR